MNGTQTGKSTGTNNNTGTPSWATVGSDAYNTMNSSLATSPMKAAETTFNNGGMTPASTAASNTFSNIASGGGTNANIDWATNLLKNNAGQSVDTSQLQSILAGMGGGSNPNIQYAIDALKGNQNVDTSGLQSVMDGMNPATVSNSNFQNLYDKSGQPGANEQYLTGTANGSMLTSNPYLDKMVQDTANSTADQVNRMFAAGGRYGSGMNQGILSDSLAKAENDLRYTNYNNERDRQMNAANAISGEQSNRIGLQGNAASGVAGIDENNVSNKMQSDVNKGNIGSAIAGIQSGNADRNNNASNAIGNFGQFQDQNKLNTDSTKANLASTIAGIQGGNIDRGSNIASTVGGIGQSQLGNQMQAAGNASNVQNQGFQNILNMIGQLPTIQGNKTYDADKQAQIGSAIDQMSQGQLDDLINQFSQMDMQDWARLGGLLSAGTTSAGNWGTQNSTTTQPMNLLGAIGTLFSGTNFASDKIVKKNIKKVGVTPGGVDVVEYDLNEKGKNLANGKSKTTGILGVIAQDAAKKQPNAVKKIKNGLLAVDYSRLK